MKLLISATVVFLFCFNVSANDTPNNPPTKAIICSGCHNKMVSLKGRGVDVITKQTKAIQSYVKPHPPAGIKDLCDEDIAEIADFLDKN